MKWSTKGIRQWCQILQDHLPLFPRLQQQLLHLMYQPTHALLRYWRLPSIPPIRHEKGRNSAPRTNNGPGQMYADTGFTCRMCRLSPSAAMWLLLRLRMVSESGRNSASSKAACAV